METTYRIPVSVGGETRVCTFSELESGVTGLRLFRAPDVFLVRYRTGKKVHERTPHFWLHPDGEYSIPPAKIDLSVNIHTAFGNSRSIEIPVSWK